jgi:SAM-dependent methyltransferase
MGTASVQGDLWGAKAADWAELGEPVSRPAFEAVFARAGVGRGTRLLDAGCGAGTALHLAHSLGAEVAGLDASHALVQIARTRLPHARIEVGDLEELPFEDAAFDAVTGFNSFQFAGDIARALREAARVCRPGGSVAMCVFGTRDECESVAHTMSAMMGLLPPPPPSPRPPLSTPGVMEGLMQEAGLDPIARETVDCPFTFRDEATAWRCFSSGGLAVAAIRQVGEEPVKRVTLESLKPFTRPDGTVHQKNRFHWVLATKLR